MTKEMCLRDWCRLVRDRRWSTRQKIQLINRFKTPEQIFCRSEDELNCGLQGRKRRKSATVREADLTRDLEWLGVQGRHLIEFTNPIYPRLLQELPDPPLALFAAGDISLLSEPSVSIVGSRRPTPVGVRVAEKIVSELAAVGIVITSGMALGIDGVAHTATLKSSGPSIAVLGAGPDVVYPARHRGLFQQLTEHGLVLSEYPVGTAPSKYTFPQRNRIVSGLSLGVVIVEAARRSGTLITATLAAEQNREVMVVPGSALSRSYEGSHELIRQGAPLVQDAKDILNCLSGELNHLLSPRCQESEPFVKLNCSDPDRKHLLRCIGATSTSVSDIILASGLTAAEVSSMLITLELEGVVAIEIDGGYVNLT